MSLEEVYDDVDLTSNVIESLSDWYKYVSEHDVKELMKEDIDTKTDYIKNYMMKKHLAVTALDSYLVYQKYQCKDLTAAAVGVILQRTWVQGNELYYKYQLDNDLIVDGNKNCIPNSLKVLFDLAWIDAFSDVNKFNENSFVDFNDCSYDFNHMTYSLLNF